MIIINNQLELLYRELKVNCAAKKNPFRFIFEFLRTNGAFQVFFKACRRLLNPGYSFNGGMVLFMVFNLGLRIEILKMKNVNTGLTVWGI